MRAAVRGTPGQGALDDLTWVCAPGVISAIACVGASVGARQAGPSTARHGDTSHLSLPPDPSISSPTSPVGISTPPAHLLHEDSAGLAPFAFPYRRLTLCLMFAWATLCSLWRGVGLRDPLSLGPESVRGRGCGTACGPCGLAICGFLRVAAAPAPPRRCREGGASPRPRAGRARLPQVARSTSWRAAAHGGLRWEPCWTTVVDPRCREC